MRRLLLLLPLLLLPLGALLLPLGALMLPLSSLAAEDPPPAAEPAAAAEPGAAQASPPDAGRPPLRPTASVTMKITNVSVGVAINWGKGVLTFENRNHPFRVRGLGIVGVGGSSIDASGTVFNLERLEDFEGSWAQIDGAAVLGRASSGGVSLSNGPAVMILTGSQKGARLGAGGGAVRIELLEKPAGDPEKPPADAE